ncbi:sigma 54-interacting transcriptional regulator [uncultured Paludibaculum sp.]|uniref:sigma 54-interacting transcriptional regulator n=1 Tax=uncultured Paludibaculum sp. TaxID=1765020 RepID=UPI002AAA717B|nr:sigma 54-interacting transcriptional regulator [uncultured Paludibaculum sp.]
MARKIPREQVNMAPTTSELAFHEAEPPTDCGTSLESDILRNIQAVAWTVTLDGRMDFINRFYLDASGLEFADCTAPPDRWNEDGSSLPPFLASLHPDHQERIRKLFWDGIRSGQGWTFEAPFLHVNDGRYHWHLDRAVPVRDRDGKIVRFVGTCADINELKQAEEKNLALLEMIAAISEHAPHRRPHVHSTDCSPAFDAVCQALNRVMTVDWAQLVMHKGNEFTVLSTKGSLELNHFEPEIKHEANSVGWVVENLQPLLRMNLQQEARYEDERQLASVGLRAYMIVPLPNAGRSMGVLRIASMNPRQYTLEDIKFLTEVAKQLSLAVETMVAYEEIASLKAKLEIENSYLQDEIRREHNFEEILGNSPELLKLLDRVESAAPTDANVLIIGETGSGKELIVRAIHSRSLRKNSPLVKVNCGAIPSGLVESELFGHVKGAFTSASERRIGRFELANNGTLFLDEVGELPLETQVKLLRVLQEQEFEPVGSSRTIKVNVRIIAATNRDLEKSVLSGGFRSDLYYRLNVIPLRVPALRDRKTDIPQIAMALLRQSAKRMGKSIESISRESMRLLVDYCWPGNVRELQNVIERGVVLSKGDILRLGSDLLPIEVSEASPESALTPETQVADSLEEIQRQHILQVLAKTGWVISGPSGAGAILDIHPNTLRSLMSRLGIRRALQTAP